MTHIAASQVSISSGTDHVVGDQAAPPVRLGAVGVANHRQESLLQDVSDGASSCTGEQVELRSENVLKRLSCYYCLLAVGLHMYLINCNLLRR